MKRRKTVYIAGCWDFCHEGHINIIKKAKEFGDFLVVAVNSDDFIFDYKKIKMAQDETTRFNQIRDLIYVDVAFILEDYESQSKYIDIFKPSVIVHGSDWSGSSLYKQMNITEEQIEMYGIEFKYPDYTAGVSSTMLREKLK
jgi:glycerol-3-phosphate cytidylyltransferase